MKRFRKKHNQEVSEMRNVIWEAGPNKKWKNIQLASREYKQKIKIMFKNVLSWLLTCSNLHKYSLPFNLNVL